MEVLGSLHYPLNSVPPGKPMIHEAELSMGYRTAHWQAATLHEVEVVDTQHGRVRYFERQEAFRRDAEEGPGGSVVPLFTSVP
jgi:hypothetical protein